MPFNALDAPYIDISLFLYRTLLDNYLVIVAKLSQVLLAFRYRRKRFKDRIILIWYFLKSINCVIILLMLYRIRSRVRVPLILYRTVFIFWSLTAPPAQLWYLFLLIICLWKKVSGASLNVQSEDKAVAWSRLKPKNTMKAAFGHISPLASRNSGSEANFLGLYRPKRSISATILSLDNRWFIEYKVIERGRLTLLRMLFYSKSSFDCY